ncbi:class II fructose-bisphosphate aldolase [Roseisalinus antarcticus]|uniref:Putative fructose-bisphosphate aldolase n=1 Tax=Roseisalinus antarcticus TaxID=254357 RepID=A0A1Y5TKM1_9RHOB|nr:class II fructose-bisphosphate aldolase [Roseisalinus antarcticus]SLN66207.1 putative fructose-bisphosphate aldolase [Roseisalinus antarcticus]
MTRASLADVLGPAMAGGHAVAGVVCLGWEDARAYVAAAEAEGLPIILQAGPGCRAHMPLPIIGAMFRHLAVTATVPVVTHLDHGRNAEECAAAIAEGFSSVMYDGSRLPFDENVAQTARIVALAHAAGVSCEGEIGLVGYVAGDASEGTDPAEAARFAELTGVDALAVSVGNIHLQTASGDGLDEPRLRAIEALTPVPLVIHGGSGVPMDQRTRLSRTSNICKYNIGTELRQVFGAALRDHLARDADDFDRISILGRTHDPLVAATRRILRAIGPAA